MLIVQPTVGLVPSRCVTQRSADIWCQDVGYFNVAIDIGCRIAHHTMLKYYIQLSVNKLLQEAELR